MSRAFRLAVVQACLPVLILAGAKPDLVRAEGSIDAMGTAFTVAAYAEDRGRIESAVAQALEEARRLDHMLSNYRPESEWSDVNLPFGSDEHC